MSKSSMCQIDYWQKKQINPVPPLIGKGFGQDKEPNKNEDDPSKIGCICY